MSKGIYAKIIEYKNNLPGKNGVEEKIILAGEKAKGTTR